jgi:hypothetical protein
LKNACGASCEKNLHRPVDSATEILEETINVADFHRSSVGSEVVASLSMRRSNALHCFSPSEARSHREALTADGFRRGEA